MIASEEMQSSIETVRETVKTAVDELFSSTDRIAAEVSRLAQEHDRLATSQLEPLRVHLSAELETHPYFVGCGVVFGRSALIDAIPHWEWYRAGDQFDPRPRALALAEVGDGRPQGWFEEMDWYTIPRTGRKALVGPYLDFAGSDRLILTASRPIHHHAIFLGVSAVHVSVQTFEPMLLRILNQTELPLAVINGSGRVIVSNTADATPAERLSHVPKTQTEIGGPEMDWLLARL